MKAILLMLVFLSANACVSMESEEQYSKYLGTFIGKSKKALISQWGAPNRKLDVEDNGMEVIYVYIEDKGTRINPMGDTAVNMNCKTEFTIVKNVVKSWSYDGYCE